MRKPVVVVCSIRFFFCVFVRSFLFFFGGGVLPAVVCGQAYNRFLVSFISLFLCCFKGFVCLAICLVMCFVIPW